MGMFLYFKLTVTIFITSSAITYRTLHHGEWFICCHSSLLCLQVELYTKGNGLYASTHHFLACKSYGTTISILLQPNQPQLNILSQPNQTQLNILSQPNQPQLNILSQPNQPQIDILSRPSQPQLDILSQPNRPQLNILSQPNQSQLDILSQPN